MLSVQAERVQVDSDEVDSKKVHFYSILHYMTKFSYACIVARELCLCSYQVKIYELGWDMGPKMHEIYIACACKLYLMSPLFSPTLKLEL